jgi:hypothetical protein
VLVRERHLLQRFDEARRSGDLGALHVDAGDQRSTIVESIRDLKEHIMRKMNRERSVRAQLASLGDAFNDRQIAILRGALEKPTTVFSVKEHSRAHNISDESARNDLAVLPERGLMVKHRRGRVLAFIPISNLAQTLAILRSALRSLRR